MTLPDIIAVLSNEPFNRSMEEIKRLTLFQALSVVMRRRKKDGTLLSEPHKYIETDILTDEQNQLNYSRMHKVPLWFLREKHGIRTR